MPQIERAVIVSSGWLAIGLVLSVPLLLVDVGVDPSSVFLVHLSVVTLLGLGLSIALTPFADDGWFEAAGWSLPRRLVASGVCTVFLSTGVIGLVTLASSAALRFDVSTQFLQLLSALDIAWVVAATVVGATRAWGRVTGAVAGGLIGALCVWSIWNYISIVGFGPDGSWIVSGADLMRYVIPFDMAAAVVALGVFWFGVRSATVHASPQS